MIFSFSDLLEALFPGSVGGTKKRKVKIIITMSHKIGAQIPDALTQNCHIHNACELDISINQAIRIGQIRCNAFHNASMGIC